MQLRSTEEAAGDLERIEEAIESDMLKKAATANSKDDFRYVFEKAFEGLVIDRMDGNEEIFGRLMTDAEFRKLAIEHLLHKVYGALKKTESTTPGQRGAAMQQSVTRRSMGISFFSCSISSFGILAMKTGSFEKLVKRQCTLFVCLLTGIYRP